MPPVENEEIDFADFLKEFAHGTTNKIATLHRRKEIERDAFNDVRNTISESTAVLLLAGKP